MASDKLLEQLESQRRRVDFDTYDIIVEQLISMVGSGSIDVAPAYQRQFRWDDLKRCQLIESIFLGVPVPSLFMATNRDGSWELVDGVQRLSTIVQFAGTGDAREKLKLPNPLTLKGLEKLSEFNELRFQDLPDSLRLQFLRRPIKVVTLSDKSDLIVRFDLFERLNTGGVALTNQEIRACIFRGEFSDFLGRISQNDDFKATVRLTKKQEHDGTREECVLRFFAFLDRYQVFDHSVVDFLNAYMRDTSKSFNLSKLERIFKDTFDYLNRALPSGIVRATTRSTTPITLFEGVAVGAALALQQRSDLPVRSAQSWIQSEELKRYTTGATNNRRMVVKRIEYCRDCFLVS
jgi:hypothetical protein